MAGLLHVRQMVRDLWSQKLRTSMTIFGIVWGTVAISLLLAFGQGFHQRMATNFAGIGEYIVIAWPARTSIPWEGLPKGRRIFLTEDDMQLVRERSTAGLLAVSGEYSDNLLLNHNEKTVRVDVSGVAPEFGDLRNLVPAAGGRFINALDWRDRRRVLFMGDKLAKEVFGAVDAVGRMVLLHGSPFLVVGVLQPKEQDSSYSGRDQDKIFIPGTTFSALTGGRYVDNVIFKARTSAQTPALKDEITALLAARHRFSPEDKEVLQMWDTTENMQFLDTFMTGFRLFLGVIGILTLVVGGIGVSNIMNVVVEERTREIGIKLALGARPRSVMNQFLVETLIITAIGGVLGIFVSSAICASFPALQLDEYVGTPRITAPIGLCAAGLLGVIGLIAGWFPARSAARLDPVVAMKT